MKSKFFLFAILGVALFINKPAQAQLNVNINIGSQPLWGPTGYDHVDYYYMPDINTYYYVPSKQYVYQENNKWVWRNRLPASHSDYNLYNGYKVVVNEPTPYLRNNVYKEKYNMHAQVIQPAIRDSRDTKYYVVKGHPNYNGGGKAPAKIVKRRTTTTVVKTHTSNNGKGNNVGGNSKGNNGNGKGNNGNGGGKGNGRH